MRANRGAVEAFQFDLIDRRGRLSFFFLNYYSADVEDFCYHFLLITRKV